MSFSLSNLSSTPHTRLPLKEIWSDSEAVEKYGELGLQGQFFKAAIRNIKSSPFSSIVTFATISLSLLLVGLLLSIFLNLEAAALNTRSSFSARVFFSDSSADTQIEKISNQIKSWEEVEKVRVISKSEALEEFKESLGDESDLIAGLEGRNPLPASIDVKLKEDLASVAVFERLKEKFGKNENVEKIDYNQGLLERINQLISSYKQLGYGLILFVLVVVCFLVSNTIILSVYARKDEIEIMRLVGASTSYVRAPYMLEGLIFGAVGSVFSLIILFAILTWSGSLLGRFNLFEALSFEIQYPSLFYVFILFLTGILIGFVGSSIAVRRFDEF